jgi:hypothetical protein
LLFTGSLIGGSRLKINKNQLIRWMKEENSPDKLLLPFNNRQYKIIINSVHGL